MVFDYSKSKIYKLSHPDTDKIYIGSTIQQLNRRLSEHKSDYNRYKKNEYNFVTSFFLFELGIDDVKIELIEFYPCETKKQLEIHEGHVIQELTDTCVNKRISTKMSKKERETEYYQNNKDKIKQYYQENKDKIKEYREENKEKIEEYREKNKERIKQKSKQYYKNKKEIISEKGKTERMICDTCNLEIRKDSYKRHCTSKTHINNLNKQDSP